MPGTLFVVATPIGNLEDVTLRALRTLREVDLIAAEDTRRTAKLLARYEIRSPLTSLHEHNEVREAPRLVAALQAGQSIALVSDAGTPGIADPGARLVRAARDAGLTVVPIPGPNAVAAALSVAGFAADEFTFMGFAPRSGSERKAWFERLNANPATVVFFETPHRIKRTLIELATYAERPIMLCREVTKINEEYAYWPNVASASVRKELGEFVIVIGPGAQFRPIEPPQVETSELFYRLTDIAMIDAKVAVTMIAKRYGLEERTIVKLIKKGRILANRAAQSSS